MADKLYGLTDADLPILKEMKEDYLRRKGSNPGGRGRGWFDLEDPTAPECYVAWVGADGIPALNDQDTTGIGTEAGTGTGSAQMDDVVGSAVCEVYQMRIENGSRKLFAKGFTRRVHNLMTTAVPGSRWILIHRDKYGTWWVNPLPFDLEACP